MSDPLLRGAVVLRDGRFSVVWDVRAHELVLLPVIRPRRRWDYDVHLDLPDLVAGNIVLPGGGATAVVRPRRNPPIAIEGHTRVGTLPGATMCRVVHALARAWAEQVAHDKWTDDERHRANASAPCVNLVG